WRTVRELKRICRENVAAFDHVWVTCDEDVPLAGARRVSVVPNLPFNTPQALLENVASREILFVGDLEHGPNARGLERFLAHAWPAIRSAIPDAALRIVGRGLDESRRQRWSALGGTHVDGPVDDLNSAYERSALTIAPVFWGGGTKIKVLESLAYGRACVAT